MVDTQFNKKPFVIIGAGGLGREIFSWISQSQIFSNKFECIGFIDDTLDKVAGSNYPKVIDNTIDNDFSNYSNVLLAIADSNFRKEVLGILKNETKVIGFIHDTVLLGMNCEYCDDLIALPNVIISCDTKIGKSVFVNNGTQIGHDVIIGAFTNVMANVDIGGHCQIGSNVTIGSGATILPKVKIPDNTIIGAGSVVIKSIKESGTYFGNPSKRII
jgi:sugar O-acyltransferase (sialic acid O-acetyltransferase NeuD family)